MRYATSQKALQRLDQEQPGDVSPSQTTESIRCTEIPQTVDSAVRYVDTMVGVMRKDRREQEYSVQAGRHTNVDGLRS